MLRLEHRGGRGFQLGAVKVVGSMVSEGRSEQVLEMHLDPDPAAFRISSGELVTTLVDDPNLDLISDYGDLEVACILEHLDIALLGNDDLCRIHVGRGVPQQVGGVE